MICVFPTSGCFRHFHAFSGRNNAIHNADEKLDFVGLFAKFAETLII
jgi:hypothetical protein